MARSHIYIYIYLLHCQHWASIRRRPARPAPSEGGSDLRLKLHTKPIRPAQAELPPCTGHLLGLFGSLLSRYSLRSHLSPSLAILPRNGSCKRTARCFAFLLGPCVRLLPNGSKEWALGWAQAPKFKPFGCSKEGS